MTFDEADRLTDELLEFFRSVGGFYENMNPNLETVILDCLGSGQYIIKRDGGIKTALFYWMVHPYDIKAVVEGGTPEDHYHGKILYISDCGNKGTTQDIRNCLNEITRLHKPAGIFCHRDKGFRFKRFKEGLWAA